MFTLNAIKNNSISLLMSVGLFGALIIAEPGSANPVSGQVVAGTATIVDSRNLMQITQTSDKAVIDWRSFSIDANQTTRFIQPSAHAIILNRVTGNDPSKIFGNLIANGQVFLVNPNGILFGKGSVVDVAGLVATTLNISNQDFMNGHYYFKQAPNNFNSVINEGTIRVSDTGLVALVAPGVANRGVIQANFGKVTLASGMEFTIVDPYGDQLIAFAADSQMKQAPVDINGRSLEQMVANTGVIIAKGGKVLMTANTAANVVDHVINMDGVIQAQSVAEHEGEVVLAGGDAGIVAVSGHIDVSGKAQGAKGGKVQITGEKVGLFDHALIDASGDQGGGKVLVGGDYQGANPAVTNAKMSYVGRDARIKADAITAGDGGRVIVWGDDVTRFYGEISARGGSQRGDGGFVEVSGKSLGFAGVVDTSAANGQLGMLLLDPKNITVSANGSATLSDVDAFHDDSSDSETISASVINAATTNVMLQANNDITISAAINMTKSGASFTARAGRDIKVDADIKTNNGNISLTANDSGAIPGKRSSGTGDLTMVSGTTLNAGTANVSLTIDPTSNAGFSPGNIVVDKIIAGSVVITSPYDVTLANDINASTVTVVAGRDIKLKDTITASAAGNAIVLAATRNFINEAGATALQTSNGRWLIYSNDPSANTFGGLVSGNAALWNSTYANNAPGTIQATGNRYVFKKQPTLTLTSTSQSKTYGDTKDLTGAYSTSGFQTNTYGGVFVADTLAMVVSGAPTLTSAGAAANANVGNSYAITIGQGTLQSLSGYALKFTSTGKLTVGKAALTIAANDQTKTYGDIKTFSGTEFTATGLKNGETVGSTSLASTGATAIAGVAVTPYEITISGATGGTFNASNYAISYVKGKLTVEKKDVVVTANGGTSTYGSSATNPGLSATGLVNGQTVTSLTGLTNSFGINNNTNAGNYTLQVAGTLTNVNYRVVQSNTGNWTVNRKDITVTALGGNSVYGDSPTSPGFTATGLVNGQTVGALTGLKSSFNINNNTNAGNYVLEVAGILTNNNYNVTQRNTANWRVDKKNITVTASGGNSVYGDTPVNPGFTATGLVNGQTVNVLTGLSNSFGITGTTNKGSYTLQVVGTLDSNNYNVTQRNTATWSVSAAPLIISANDQTKTYGDTKTFSGSEFTATGLKNNETVGSTTLASTGAAATANVGATPYSITISNALGGTFNASNYSIIYANGKLTVTPAPLTVTATNQTKTYGDTKTFTGSEFTATGLKNGQTLQSATLASTGAAAIADVTNSPYAITVTNAMGSGTFNVNNYSITYVNGGLTITPKNIVVTANSGVSTYGSAPVSPGLSATGLVNGQNASVLTGLSNSFGITNNSDAGDYALHVAGTLTNSNYNVVQLNGGNWKVNPKEITVTANGGVSTYGDSPVSPGLSATGLVNGQGVGVLHGLNNDFSVTNNSNAGNYALHVTGTLTNNNYKVVQLNDGNWIVNRKDITVTAVGGNSVYGDNSTNPGFTATGLVNGQTTNVLTGLSNSFGINNNTNAGTYALQVAGTLTNTNYNITQRNTANWIVSPATLTVTAVDQTKVYGDVKTFAGTEFTATGLKNNETVGSVTLASIGSATTADVTVAPYDITISNAAGGTFNANNYSINYVNGALTISPKDIVVTANGGTSTYGDNPANPGLSATGLVNGQGVNVLTGLTNSFGVNNNSDAGNYVLQVVGTLTNDNYHVVQLNNGNWIVTPKGITVTANSGTSTYGDSPGNAGLSATGLVNGQGVNVLTGLSNSFGVNNNSNAGNYALHVEGVLSNGNYTVLQANDGNWVVSPKSITVIANSGVSTYGDSPVNPGLSATGLVNGQTVGVLTGLNNSFGITNNNNAGNYSLHVMGSLTNQNYVVSQRIDGNWTVDKASLTITANDATRLFDHPNPTFTASYSGFKNGDNSGVVSGLTFATSANLSSPPGIYSIKPSGAVATNYVITYRDGTLLVDPYTPPRSPVPTNVGNILVNSAGIRTPLADTSIIVTSYFSQDVMKKPMQVNTPKYVKWDAQVEGEQLVFGVAHPTINPLSARSILSFDKRKPA